MLNKIISDLGENYNSNDDAILQQIIDDTTANALFISNRSDTTENRDLLEYEIKNCVKAIYLSRGSEDVKNSSQSGLSATFKDAYEDLRLNIIKNGKRVIK